MASVAERQWLGAICELCPETEGGFFIGSRVELALARTIPDSWSRVQEKAEPLTTACRLE